MHGLAWVHAPIPSGLAVAFATGVMLTSCSGGPAPDGAALARIYTRAEIPEREYGFPSEIARTYVDGGGKERVYLVQEPEPVDDSSCMLVYLHGAGGREGQGMGDEFAQRTFNRLRTLMAEKQWTYVSPRDYEFDDLRRDIERRYGKRKVFLAGPSAGGKAVLFEALKNPDAYVGLILMCPAWHFAMGGISSVKPLRMPIVLVSGEKDGVIAPFCRELATRLAKRNRQFVFAEIPGAGHAEPLVHMNWERAVAFLTDAAGPS